MDKIKVLIIGTGRNARMLQDLRSNTLFDVTYREGVEEKMVSDFNNLETRMLAKTPCIHYWDDYNPEGADHPSRKREPKGPRGRWGKPK